MTFLILPDHDRYSIGHHYRHIDKAIKLVAGSLFALTEHSPKYIMPIDGDDLFRTDLVQTALSTAELENDEDGWIVTRGVNLDLYRRDDFLRFRAAYRVNRFHRGFGCSETMYVKMVFFA